MIEIDLCGERVALRADRTLFWPARRTLVIADPHFGKFDTFRAAAIPVPGGADPVLARLAAALTATGADRLVVLGDFWHARPGRTSSLVAELTKWRAAQPGLRIELIRGNHDRAGAPPAGWADSWQEGPLVDPPFAFTHFPQSSATGYVLAGHLHPGVILAGRGRQQFRLPCFRFSSDVGILPAFGAFTGTAAEPPRRGDRVYAVADDEVIDVTVAS